MLIEYVPVCRSHASSGGGGGNYEQETTCLPNPLRVVYLTRGGPFSRGFLEWAHFEESRRAELTNVSWSTQGISYAHRRDIVDAAGIENNCEFQPA